jgi:hypothetical protein
MGRASRGRLRLMLGLKGLIDNMTRRLLLGTGLNVTSFVELINAQQMRRSRRKGEVDLGSRCEAGDG